MRINVKLALIFISEEMVRVKDHKMKHSLICFAALLLVLTVGLGKVMAVERDCDGYIVQDTAVINEPLQRVLQRSDSSSYPGFTLYFRDPGAGLIMPDSCRDVKCSDFDYTFSYRFYEKWAQRLFSDYELFNGNDHSRPLTPEEAGVWSEYDLSATKSTILAISKECYVWGLSIQVQNVGMEYPATTVPPSPNPSPSSFSLIGQKLEPRKKSEGSIRLPVFSR